MSERSEAEQSITLIVFGNVH